MKKLKEKINFKNAYFLTTAIVSIFILVTCFSYAIFTATKERKGVLNIMAGNLYPKIIINDTDTTSYEIEKGTSKTLTLVIENINGIESKYNIFYKDNLIEDVEIGYPSSMSELLTNQNFILNPYGNSGSSKEVKVVVNNFSETDVVVEFGLGISLVNNEVEEIEGYKKINKNLEQVKSSLAMDNEMIPVYYDESDEVWRKADSYNLGDSWYNYQNQKWANAVTTDNKIALDLSSRLNNATLVGNPTFNSGALVCDGVDDWVNVGLKNISLPKFTMAIKFRVNSANSGNKALFGNWNGQGIGISVNVNGNILFGFYNSSSSSWYYLTVNIGSDISIRDVMIVGTYDGTTLKLFADGVLVGEESLSYTYIPSVAPFGICSNPNATGVDANTAFNVYEAAMYSKAVSDSYVASNMATTMNLTDEEDLLFHYDFSKGTSKTDNTKILNQQPVLNHGTINGDAEIKDGALVCDGVDDWVNVGLKNISLPKFTMAIKFLKEETLVNKSLFGNWSTAGIGIEVTGNQIINFCFYDKTTSAYVFYTVDIGIDMSTQDVLLVITYDEASLKIFANGNLVVTEEATLVYKPASVPFALCANPKSNGVDAYGGGFTIYEAAIYSKAVSDSYVASNMATTLNLTDKEDLLVYYDFGEKVEIANDTYIDMDMVNTMWTYIPRYSYTIGSMDGVNYYGKQGEYITTNPSNSLPGEIDIKFIEKEEKDTGSGKYIVSEGISNYKTPEAFTFGDLELEGFWIGKFETSSVDSVNKIIPNVNSINNLNISSCYENSKNMTSDGNIYGLDSEVVDTHLTKNSEWEAVTYLTQSKYGKFGNTNYTGVNKEVANNSSTVTGCFQGSGTNCTSDYINGKEASTTGTIYGVYDMNGSRDEYVMGNYNDILSTSGFSSLPSLNYYDKYTTVDSLLLTSGWYNDDYSEIGESAPWIVRGGYNGSNSGIFSLKATDGSANSNIGYRISLINK